MTFLAPAMFYAMALASIPIIIHLLNRRRFVRIDWAPMRYLKLTLRTNRRKLQLEQWLLLAVRTLALALLFLALARPLLPGGASWLGGKGRAARVLVIDDSPGMAVVEEGRSALDRAKQAASQLVRETGAKDQLTVFTTSQPDAPLVRQTQLEEPSALLRQISQLPASDVASNWSATLQQIDRRLQEAAYPTQQVVIVTDLQARGWAQDVAPWPEQWSERGVSLRVIDVGREPTANLSLDDLRLRSAIALAGQDFQVDAVLHNHGEQPLAELLATLRIGGAERTVELPVVPAGQTATATITVRIDSPGQHALRLELPADAQVRDNRRQLVVDVQQSLSVLLVDGEPAEGLQSETGFLQAALTSGAAPWRVDVVDDLQWQDRPLAGYDVIALANVSVLSEGRADALRAHVERGRGLVIFCGELVDPQNYNRLLGGAAPLLPAALTQWETIETAGLNVAPVADSPLGVLAAAPQLVAGVRPRQVQGVKLESVDDDGDTALVRVLASWNDPAKLPALLERRVGGGRVYLWTITADRQWSDWPQEPSFVLAMRETVLSAARRFDANHNVIAGQPLTAMLPVDDLPATAELTTPAGEAEKLVVDSSDPQQPRLQFSGTRQAGVYSMSWQQAAQTVARSFAVNLDPQESDGERLAESQLRALMEPLEIELTAAGASGEQSGRELWRNVIWAMLGLLCIECGLAAWVSREH